MRTLLIPVPKVRRQTRPPLGSFYAGESSGPLPGADYFAPLGKTMRGLRAFFVGSGYQLPGHAALGNLRSLGTLTGWQPIPGAPHGTMGFYVDGKPTLPGPNVFGVFGRTMRGLRGLGCADCVKRGISGCAGCSKGMGQSDNPYDVPWEGTTIDVSQTPPSNAPSWAAASQNPPPPTYGTNIAPVSSTPSWAGPGSGITQISSGVYQDQYGFTYDRNGNVLSEPPAAIAAAEGTTPATAQQQTAQWNAISALANATGTTASALAAKGPVPGVAPVSSPSWFAGSTTLPVLGAVNNTSLSIGAVVAVVALAALSGRKKGKK